MSFIDWLLAAPMWIKASLSCAWWLVIYLLVHLAVCAVTGDRYWTFGPTGALTLGAVSYLLGWKQRGEL